MSIVKILHGSPCIIMLRHSKVILHVPKGLYGVILGNAHQETDFIVRPIDRIVRPMYECEFHSYDDISEGAWIKIEVPHIEGGIKVIYKERYQRYIKYAQKLEPGQELPDRENVYYRSRERYVEIFHCVC